MRKALPSLFAVAIAVTSSAAVHALEAEDDSGLRFNCAGDYFRYCTAYEPGSAAIKQCFGRNFARLAPACQSAIRDFDRRAGRTNRS